MDAVARDRVVEPTQSIPELEWHAVVCTIHHYTRHLTIIPLECCNLQCVIFTQAIGRPACAVVVGRHELTQCRCDLTGKESKRMGVGQTGDV